MADLDQGDASVPYAGDVSDAGVAHRVMGVASSLED